MLMKLRKKEIQYTVRLKKCQDSLTLSEKNKIAVSPPKKPISEMTRDEAKDFTIGMTTKLLGQKKGFGDLSKKTVWWPAEVDWMSKVFGRGHCKHQGKKITKIMVRSDYQAIIKAYFDYQNKGMTIALPQTSVNLPQNPFEQMNTVYQHSQEDFIDRHSSVPPTHINSDNQLLPESTAMLMVGDNDSLVEVEAIQETNEILSPSSSTIPLPSPAPGTPVAYPSPEYIQTTQQSHQSCNIFNYTEALNVPGEICTPLDLSIAKKKHKSTFKSSPFKYVILPLLFSSYFFMLFWNQFSYFF